MRDTVLHIEQLGKHYRHAPAARRHMTLRDRMVSMAQGVARKAARHDSRSLPETVATHWALRDVTLDVGAGEILGLAGPNGSGKSTLLKIVARITQPSTGRVRVRGRVGALLEIGTGFHMELSGRENIYLSGAILGMRRAEIRANFDAIVAMSGIEAFLELPVKRYSSGMYLRLAFAVAAHLESQVLLLDEVLAVGDEDFQRTCREKIVALARAGRTILLVSHDSNLLRSICHRVVRLDGGRVQAVGHPQDILPLSTAA